VKSTFGTHPVLILGSGASFGAEPEVRVGENRIHFSTGCAKALDVNSDPSPGLLGIGFEHLSSQNRFPLLRPILL
jgi:hypothetical protein